MNHGMRSGDIYLIRVKVLQGVVIAVNYASMSGGGGGGGVCDLGPGV